jgi:alpha/beta hydrolase fold
MHEISTHFVNRLRSRAEAARPRPSTHRGRYSVRHIHSRRLPISFTSLHSINFSTIFRKSRQEYSRRANSNRLPLLQLRGIIHALQGFAQPGKSLISKPLFLSWIAQRCTVLRSRWCQSGVTVHALGCIDPWYKHRNPFVISLSGVSTRRIIQWIGKALVGLIVALLALAVVGAIYQAIATERAERAYPPPGEMVDVGGHSLHINCVGQGSPTVLLDGGSGEWSAQWVRVQQEVSDTTRVCAYDRAGMGWSEMGPEPRDAGQIPSELHTLLSKAGIEGPYVLVGHSFGGMYMQMYAARYPDEVAGVALVDSSTEPDQFSLRSEARDGDEPQEQSFAVVSLLARLGVVRLLSKLDPASPELPPRQRAQIDALSPSTPQVRTTAGEFFAPTQTR